VFYLEFWTNYWKELAEAAADKPAENSPTPQKTALPAHTDIDRSPIQEPEIEKFPAPAHMSAIVAPAEAISSKEKYEYLTEYGTQILCMLSGENGCSYLSRNFETITGQKLDAHLGAAFYDILHPDFRERLQAIIHAPAPENMTQPLRCKLTHADGKYYWYLFLIHPKEKEAGEFVCIVENIHESVQAQNTLQKARLEAELALRARSEFLANMSHELRTPLNAVIGFSQLIESQMFGQIENPHYMEYVKHIHESGYDLLAKIEDLLEIANIDAGRVRLSREEIHVSDIIKYALEAQAHHAQDAKVKLESAPLAEDILLHVDRLKLQHILGHLVANAIKFSAAGDTITITAKQAESGALQLVVQDTGHGMAAEKLTAILTALQEDNCWSSHENKNIGLGLALTREFVALHGGQVAIDSQQGGGTRIEITLPKDCIRAVVPQQLEYRRQAVH